MQQRTTKVNASEETIQIGPLGIRFLLIGADSNGSVSVFEVLVPVGQKLAAPAHKNDAYEEVLYGIEGVLTWTVDGIPIEVGPGQTLCIPRGAVHRFDNLGNEDVKQLAVISPAIMGPAYFREAAEVINATAGVKLLFATQIIDPDLMTAALSNGAHGYIRKADAASELLPAIWAIRRGEKFIGDGMKG